MNESDCVVAVERVARRLGLKTQEITSDQREAITDAILDAQDQVEGYLGRPLTPSGPITLTGLYPQPGHELTSWQAWPQLLEQHDDDITIVSTEAEDGGSYAVTFTVGLNGKTERPIANFVRAHAVESLRNDPVLGIGQKRVKSLSAEGQSLTFDMGSQDREGGAGALPTLKSLNRYRRYSVRKQNLPPRPPWPQTSALDGWDPR